MLETQKLKPTLIIDSNAIIKHENLDELYLKYNIKTVPKVINEIRDPTARKLLKSLTFDLQETMPKSSSIDFVINFAKKTGDFISISPVDAQIIALAYELIKDSGKESFVAFNQINITNQY